MQHRDFVPNSELNQIVILDELQIAPGKAKYNKSMAIDQISNEILQNANCHCL